MTSILNGSDTPLGPEYESISELPTVEYFLPPGTLLLAHIADQEATHCVVSGYSGQESLLIAFASSQIVLKATLSVTFIVLPVLMLGMLTVTS